ncbi:cell envelope integrity protein TolA [Cognaticolwellia aestuarii]|uniref:cell envelope integrity protein TolA n=1 Tax=Cognaticolwellia aestuarii TaxID=329993 RepID=UPI000986F0EE|nr:cell envelope integrity protein TolA [Cognaticolwellia aestuarii]
MGNFTSKIFCSFALIIALTGCLQSTSEPNVNDISDAIKFKLPNKFILKELKIDVQQNLGNEVEPKYATRFRGTVTLTENLYKIEYKILGKDVLSKTSDKNTDYEIFGTTNSKLALDKWQVSVDNIDIQPLPTGKSLTNWGTTNFVISGSPGEKSLVSRQEEMLQAKKEREAKLKAEKEKEAQQRIELAKKKEQKVHKNKLALVGKWKGKYMCEILTDFEIELSEFGEILVGSFTFYKSEGTGIYTIIGDVTEDGLILFQPRAWKKQLKGYSSVGFHGSLSSNKRSLTGKINFNGCDDFTLSKV